MSILTYFLSFVQFQGWPVSHAQAGHDAIQAWQRVLNSLPQQTRSMLWHQLTKHFSFILQQLLRLIQ